MGFLMRQNMYLNNRILQVQVYVYVANDYENVDEKASVFARAADFSNIEFLFQNGYSKIYQCVNKRVV